MTIRLDPMTSATAAALLAGDLPTDIAVAADYPTEFSRGVAAQVAHASELGPYVVVDRDGVVVGEIGAALVAPGTVELGYAIVPSRWGRGLATTAVGLLLERLAARTDVIRIVAHTPLDRPASGRVVAKAGFTLVGEVEDVHEGVVLRVQEWERATSSAGYRRA